jgi:hypothetical protein
MLGAALVARADESAQLRPPVEVPSFLAHLPKHDLKLDTLSGCGLIDSASIGPGATLFGLRIGRDSLEDAVTKLQRQGAQLKADLGYRGYREDLPIAALQTLPPAQAAGPLAEGWLRFNALGVLYRMTLVFAGNASKGAYELLANDAPELAQACNGKTESCSAKQNGVALELNARDGQVVLSIASVPLDAEARNTEKLIDADIRRKRVGAARNDK